MTTGMTARGDSTQFLREKVTVMRRPQKVLHFECGADDSSSEGISIHNLTRERDDYLQYGITKLMLECSSNDKNISPCA